jgi:predicted dehydrogenase
MRVAVVGPGGIARRHLALLREEPGVEIVGHLSRSQDRADAAAREWGGPGYTDLRRLLEEQRPEAVWICTPPSAHEAVEMVLVEHGVPFFVEKPLDADCATAERVAAAVERSGLITAVGYHWRGLDTLAGVASALKDTPARLILGSWLTVTPPPAWWSDPEQGGGQMVEQATHLIDLARFLVGEGEVEAALATAPYGSPGVPGASAALIRYRSGAIGAFTATHLLPRSTQVSLALVCERLRIQITRSQVVYDRGGEVEEVPTGQDPYDVEDRAFLDALRSGDPSRVLCDYADALRSHRLACSIGEMSSQSVCL